MLILRRKANEALLIGDDIVVKILDIYEGGVRLAIEAPKEIPILRSELVQAANANRDAAGGTEKPRELMELLGNGVGAEQ